MRCVSRDAISRYRRLLASAPSSFCSRYKAFCTASRGLLISCAMEAASRPVAASFSESKRTCSRRRRSSSRRRPTSCMTETIAITAPRPSLISVALTSISRWSSVPGSVSPISPRFDITGSSRRPARNDVNRASFASAVCAARDVAEAGLKSRSAAGFIDMM